MRKPVPIHFAACALLIASLACGLPTIPVTGPSVPPADSKVIETAIAQTLSAATTRTAVAQIPIDLANSQTAAVTFTPTFTATATLSPTPFYTATPLIPLINVSVDTNCRVGPGQVYDMVGALMVGETTEVYGRDPTAKYWYVQNPDRENEYCWLWGRYATLVGNLAAVPFYTPPPTPTPPPSFDLEYVGLQVCSGWWVDIELTNTSNVAFESLSISITDQGTDVDISLYAERFTAIDDCVGSTTEDTLDLGDTLTVSTPAFAYDPSGHKLRATVTLCSGRGQKGACITNTIKFSP
jgi:hypothetical protein